MKKKGFTLIELLAVIVILAIIAVITVPKIADMISSSRKGGAEDSFYGALKSAELGFAKTLQTNKELENDTCDLSKVSGSNLTCANGTVLSFSGKTPDSGTLIIDKGSAAAVNLKINGYSCSGTINTTSPCKKNNEKKAANILREKAVSTGDGLYIDTFEGDRYIYRGTAPNNVITFNNEKWRIISVEKDDTLKIIREDILINKAFDNQNRTSDSTNFCNYIGGCNIWGVVDGIVTTSFSTGIVTKDASLNTYLNNDYYNTITTKNLIDNHNYNIGFIEWDFNSGIERINANEKTLKWKGNIGLINISDYMKASLDKKCDKIGDSRENPVCKSKNYLALDDDIWWFTISGNYNSKASAIGIGVASPSGTPGAVCSSGVFTEISSARPVVYIKDTVKLTGSGTSSDPYKIN